MVLVIVQNHKARRRINSQLAQTGGSKGAPRPSVEGDATRVRPSAEGDIDQMGTVGDPPTSGAAARIVYLAEAIMPVEKGFFVGEPCGIAMRIAKLKGTATLPE